jgi:hypothetical protein
VRHGEVLLAFLKKILLAIAVLSRKTGSFDFVGFAQDDKGIKVTPKRFTYNNS